MLKYGIDDIRFLFDLSPDDERASDAETDRAAQCEGPDHLLPAREPALDKADVLPPLLPNDETSINGAV